MVCRRAQPAADGVAAKFCTHPDISRPVSAGRGRGNGGSPGRCAGTGAFGVGAGTGPTGIRGVRDTGIGGGSEGEHGTMRSLLQAARRAGHREQMQQPR